MKSSEISSNGSLLLQSLKSLPTEVVSVAGKSVSANAKSDNKPQGAAAKIDAEANLLLPSLNPETDKAAPSDGRKPKLDTVVDNGLDDIKDILSLSDKLKPPVLNIFPDKPRIETAETAYQQLQLSKLLIIEHGVTARLAQANTAASSILNFFIK